MLWKIFFLLNLNRLPIYLVLLKHSIIFSEIPDFLNIGNVIDYGLFSDTTMTLN